MILSYTLMYRYTEYLIQTYNILFLVYYSKLMQNVASAAVFNTM